MFIERPNTDDETRRHCRRPSTHVGLGTALSAERFMTAESSLLGCFLLGVWAPASADKHGPKIHFPCFPTGSLDIPEVHGQGQTKLLVDFRSQ